MATLRKIFFNIHLYLGLAGSIILFVVAITGGILTYEFEIDHRLNSKLYYVDPQPQRVPLANLGPAAEKAVPGKRAVVLYLGRNEGLAHEVIMNDGLRVTVNPYTGAVLGSRMIQGRLMAKVQDIHRRLMLKNSLLVSYSTIAMVVLACSGLYLWWKTKIVGFKQQGSARRFNFDLHHVSGFYFLIPVLLIALSGVVLGFDKYLLPPQLDAKGRPVRPPQPASTPQPGVPAISVDDAFTKALAALPGARITTVGLALGPRATYQFTMKLPEDNTPGGRSQVAIDKYSGQVLQMQTSRDFRGLRSIIYWSRQIHTGEFWGWPTRLLFLFATLAIAVQAVSGVIMWIARIRTQRKKAAPVSSQHDPVAI